MRLLRLDLLAFGPFTEVTLDLARPETALHVVYGPNEAGKSTSLRAITGLLFGIPERTSDDHVHPMPKLRVGGCLEFDDGSRLDVVRRKGRKHTLLGPDDEPIDEARLARALRGVGRERFETMFGLDHERLRAGAEALLAGGGDVGESLFDAGLGGGGVHAMLARLEERADELFLPRGQRELNKVLADLKKAREAVRKQELSADVWNDQVRGIDEQRVRVAELRERRTALLREKSRLHREVTLLPLLAQRAKRTRELAAYGEVPALPEDAGARRRAAEAELGQRDADLARLQAELSRLDARLEEIDVPEALLEIPTDEIDALRERLGRHRSAADDLPKRRAELRVLEDQVRADLRALGAEVDVSDVESRRVDARQIARIRRLASEHERLAGERDRRNEAHAELQAKREVLADRLETLPAPRETPRLAAALAGVRRVTDADERVEDLERRVEDARRATGAARRDVAPWDVDTDEVLAARPPSAATIERYEREERAVVEGSERARSRRDELEQARRDVERELDELAFDGELPSEEQLARARAERDGRWAALRGLEISLEDGAEPFERALGAADDVADRLRREADRVARHAALATRRAQLDAELEALAAQEEEFATRRAEHERAWRTEWEPLGLAPRSPAEMRSWRAAFDTLVRAAEDQRAAERRLDERAARVEAVRAALAEALADAGVPNDIEAPLGALVAEAERRLDAEAELTARRKAARAALDEVGHELVRAQRLAEDARKAFEACAREWAEAVGALGLGADAHPVEALDVLDRHAEMFARVGEAAKLRARIVAMEDDAARFVADIGGHVRAHLPELTERPVELQADALMKRHAEARDAARRRSEARERREELLAERAEAEAGRDRAAAVIAELVGAAGATSIEDLAEIEARVETVRALRRRLAEDEDAIVAAGDGATLDELVTRETSVDDVDAARARLDDIDEELAAVDEDLEIASHALGGAERALEEMRGRSSVDAAERAAGFAERARVLALRWVRLQLGRGLLRREIERYRADNQGPILSRAAELFPRLTLGHYVDLKAGFGDGEAPELRCVREDGAEVGVRDLSDGTRDQLFLALRVASLERHARHGETMPLIVDDVLVHFDDDRARAALAVLSDLAERVQVLFFTHHAHLRGLAREAVDPARLAEHELAGAVAT